jgi:hypothetical protein
MAAELNFKQEIRDDELEFAVAFRKTNAMHLLPDENYPKG